ncbi:MAG TPA: transcriptional repressor [Phycisphaerales bacterium]|nr:transcriptional repressor [Phycisphaerales bacterium]
MQPARQILENHNLRCTAQRNAIYQTLMESKIHPTAEELLALVRPRLNSVSLATIYNTLEAFVQVGLVRKIPVGNGTCRYDADTSEHAHVSIQSDGDLMDLPDDLSHRIMQNLPREILAEVEQRLGIHVEGVNVHLVGRKV